MNEFHSKVYPYCKTLISPSEDVKVCPACGMLNHQGCWEEAVRRSIVPSHEFSFYSIKEYVSGDAYNASIEAATMGGEIAGTKSHTCQWRANPYSAIHI